MGRVNRMAGGNLAVACPRCGSTHTDEGQPVRLDALQGQLPLRRLPRTLRLLQVHLSGHRTTDMARFHSLDVVDVRRETRDAVVVTLKPRDEDAALFDFTQGPVPDLPPQVRRRRAAPQLLDLRRQGEGHLQVGIKRVDGGAFSTWANEELKAGDVLEAMPPMGRFFTADRARGGEELPRLRRRLRHHAAALDHQDRARRRAAGRPSPSSTPTGRSARSCSARSSRT